LVVAVVAGRRLRGGTIERVVGVLVVVVVVAPRLLVLVLLPSQPGTVRDARNARGRRSGERA